MKVTKINKQTCYNSKTKSKRTNDFSENLHICLMIKIHISHISQTCGICQVSIKNYF